MVVNVTGKRPDPLLPDQDAFNLWSTRHELERSTTKQEYLQ